MPSVAVLIPVLNRPHRVEPLLESLAATARRADPVFICSPRDTAQIEECERLCTVQPPLIVDWEPGRGDYARKMNRGWRETDHEWVLLGADDLVFHPGWLEAALVVHEETKACVVGTNDLSNPAVRRGHHSTHTLVHRAYGECGTADDPSVLLHEGYDHQFVDNEFVETAMWRETWAFAADSHVEHRHPIWGTAEQDETYAKGQARFAEDRRLFQSRRRLWTRRRR